MNAPSPHADTPASLGGLPQFIRYTSTYPDPSALVSALRSGPLARRGMLAGFLWALVDGTHLVSIGNVGWSREMIDRYSVIPLELDLPVVRCVIDNEASIDPAVPFGRTYLSAIDDHFLGEQFESLGAVSTVSVPLRHAGIVVGALGLVTAREWEAGDESRALLDALSSLLGMWATHPRSAALDSPAPIGPREWSLAFTPRQKQVLRLAGEGLSNTEIAQRLMVSTSSVKQDLQQAMRALRTHSRQGAYDRAKGLGLLS
ncbi:MAG TPA: hypothetical protein DCQ36_04810 [Actinobacteria bacterium]|nr:hypothetical protein [Actinomycetota bacterium]